MIDPPAPSQRILAAVRLVTLLVAVDILVDAISLILEAT